MIARKKKANCGPWSWTREEIELLKILYPKGNTKEIAERLGRPLTTVRQKAYDIGLKTNIYQYWTDEEVELLEELYKNTPVPVLSEQLGHSEGSIRIKASQLGLRKPQKQ